MMDWTGNGTHPMISAKFTERATINAIRDRLAQGSSRIGVFLQKLFPLLLAALLFFPLLLIDSTESRYTSLPIAERRMKLRELERITTAHLNAHPEDFNKLVRIISQADDALQEEEFPVQAAVVKWLERSMDEEGFSPEMPVYFFLRNIYLKDWEGAYFTQVDSGEREYLFDLMGAAIGGLYRCTCAPPGLNQS